MDADPSTIHIDSEDEAAQRPLESSASADYGFIIFRVLRVFSVSKFKILEFFGGSGFGFRASKFRV